MPRRFPDVSIIITNYNYGRYLQRCIRSCLNQKNANHEVIVVDDCSSDGTKEVIKPFLEDVKFVSTKKNSGVAVAANLGVKEARGQFFVRVDADDFVNENMAYFMKTYLESNHDAFCVSCDYVLIDSQENILERKYASRENISCGIMYRKDLFLQSGGYNESMRHCEEEELRKRLGADYKIHHLQIPFYRYRKHSENKTLSTEYEKILKEVREN